MKFPKHVKHRGRLLAVIYGKSESCGFANALSESATAPGKEISSAEAISSNPFSSRKAF